MAKLIPVIHAQSWKQVKENIQIAIDAGINQVFIINHGIHHQQMLEFAEDATATFPDLWVGINPLSARSETLLVSPNIKGYWTDVMLEQKPAHQQYFGGFAFKYQPQPKNLQEEAQAAIKKADVITTSGPGTGKSPDVSKIRDIRQAIGEHPLAIASGVTPENVDGFLPFVDYLLVATGISKNFHELDPAKVKALVAKL